MADRPLPAPLPADLPEDWTSGQIVAPDGADVGLSEQHGYNYLMGQVNAAQRALNIINEGFDGISGKRTCRFVIGTSTAGWTQADCDYLCDGTDDQVEIQAAIDAAPETGCEIVLLDGEYSLGGVLYINKGALWIHGNGESTTLVRKTTDGDSSLNYIIVLYPSTRMTDIRYRGAGATDDGLFEILNLGTIENVLFINCGYGCVMLEGSSYVLDVAKVNRCTIVGGKESHVFVRMSVLGQIRAVVSGNYTYDVDYLLDTTGSPQYNFSSIFVWGNTSESGAIKIDLDNASDTNYFRINNNVLSKIELEHSTELSVYPGRGALIFGNIFRRTSGAAISLGPRTTKNFVFGNALMSNDASGLTIVDEGDGNIIFGNSNDTGSGGGGTSGVASFNGRTGIVTPQTGDYTAAMVGARPSTWTPTVEEVGAIPAAAVTAIQSLTQAEYDALAVKNATTLYLIEG